MSGHTGHTNSICKFTEERQTNYICTFTYEWILSYSETLDSLIERRTLYFELVGDSLYYKLFDSDRMIELNYLVAHHDVHFKVGREFINEIRVWRTCNFA